MTKEIQKRAPSQEEVEKLTELYIKLEQIQGYIRKIQGRIKKYSTDLETIRKRRQEKDNDMLRGAQAIKKALSDKTI